MKDTETDFMAEYREQRKKDREDLEKDLQGDIRTLLMSRAGFNLIWWILEMSGVFVSSYTGNSDTYLNEGKRAIGLELLHRIVAVRPDVFESMIRAGRTEE